MSFIGIGINLWQPNENFAPGWVLNAGGKPATLDIDFVNNRAFAQPTGLQTVASLLTCTRASSGYYTNAAGVLSSFGNNTLRTGTNGLLVEESRTNLILQSQTFDNASWAKQTNITVTADQGAAPDGTTTADLIAATATTGVNVEVQQTVTLVAATTYAISVYAKKGTGTFLGLDLFSVTGAVGRHVIFDLSLGTVSNNWAEGTGLTLVTSSITALANGWFFCVAVITMDGNTAGRVDLHVPNNNANFNQTSGDNHLIWGAQVEAASFPTSYIPTTTVAVTRATENVVLTTPSGVVNVASHTFYSQVNNTPVGFNNNNTIIETDAATGSRIFAVNNTATAVTNGANQLNSNAFGAGSFSTTTIKVAYSSAAGGRSVVGQGGTPTTDANSQGTPSKMGLGISNAGTNGLFGYMKRVAFWNSRLTDAQLTALTT